MLALDPSLEDHMSRHHGRHDGRRTGHFIAYGIFCLVSLPVIWIRVYRLKWFLHIASGITIVYYVALLIWALATMGDGGFGSTISNGEQVEIPPTAGPNSTAWVMVSGIIATVGSIAAGILNQNDYTRMARSPRGAQWGQGFSYPFYSILTSIMGILVVAATQQRLNGPQWYLPDLLAELVRNNPTPAGRAGAFFSGLALTIGQIGSNVPGNALAGGIDLSAVFPRYINIRRGAYLTAILSPIVNPWQLVSSAEVFLSVLSGYSVFLAPMTGMMVGSYYLVHRRKLEVDSLYRGDSSSIYWYTRGINWRAPVAVSIFTLNLEE
jgi:NCS1 family nucleobase:cation symporter-1